MFAWPGIACRDKMLGAPGREAANLVGLADEPLTQFATGAGKTRSSRSEGCDLVVQFASVHRDEPMAVTAGA